MVHDRRQDDRDLGTETPCRIHSILPPGLASGQLPSPAPRRQAGVAAEAVDETGDGAVAAALGDSDEVEIGGGEQTSRFVQTDAAQRLPGWLAGLAPEAFAEQGNGHALFLS